MAMTTADGFRPERREGRGFFARALDRIVEVQVDRGRAIAKPHLLMLDDEELKRIGHTRAEIRRWPNGSAGLL